MSIRSILSFICLFTAFQTFSQGQLPTYPIGLIRGNNLVESGVADSLSVRCKIQGVVYGNNFGALAGRLQITLRDATGGIGLFKAINNLPFSITEGDSIRAIGVIDHFNGLSQMVVDSIFLISTGRPLRAPVVVNVLDEFAESNLVKLEGFKLVNASSWPTSPGGSGFTVQVTKYGLVYDVRIDNDCDLFGTPAPTGYLNIVGIGGQFDNASPLNEGYQLLPRSSADITTGQAPPKPVLNFVQTSFTVSENQGSIQIPVHINLSQTEPIAAQVISQNGSAISGTDFTMDNPALVTFPAGGDQSITVTIQEDLLVEGTETLKLSIIPFSGSSAFDLGPDSIVTITITDNDFPPSAIPLFPISVLRGTNAIQGGVADSLGKKCRITGTLYGGNLLKTEGGVLIAIRDSSGGMHLYSPAQNFGLTLLEGDSVMAFGQVGHLNGNSHLQLDSIRVLANNQPIKTAFVVDSLSEITEGDLIEVQNSTLSSGSSWNFNTGYGFYVDFSSGSKNFRLWIDNDNPLFNQNLNPAFSSFNIQGIVMQVDSTLPRNSGYVLVPRSPEDLIGITGNHPSLAKENMIIAYPNPFEKDICMQIPSDWHGRIQFSIYSHIGLKLSEGTTRTGEVSSNISSCLQKLAAGIYTCQFQFNGATLRTTVIKR